MIALLVVAVLGPVSMRYFALTMLVGMFFGTYSSIFVASPLLTVWHDHDAKRAQLVGGRNSGRPSK
jgi:preprotein translocase subunit SecF